MIAEAIPQRFIESIVKIHKALQFQVPKEGLVRVAMNPRVFYHFQHNIAVGQYRYFRQSRKVKVLSGQHIPEDFLVLTYRKPNGKEQTCLAKITGRDVKEVIRELIERPHTN